jgi:hypothetical protein
VAKRSSFADANSYSDRYSNSYTDCDTHSCADSDAKPDAHTHTD